MNQSLQCSVCYHPVQEGRYVTCEVDGCEHPLCYACTGGVNTFNSGGAPFCYACRRHVCDEHFEAFAGRILCTSCACNPLTLGQVLGRLEQDLLGKERAYRADADRLGKQIEAIRQQISLQVAGKE